MKKTTLLMMIASATLLAGAPEAALMQNKTMANQKCRVMYQGMVQKK